MKTASELCSWVESNKDDVLGFMRSAAAEVVPFSAIPKSWLKDDATPPDGPEVEYNRETVLDRMREYMDFAWEKALDERGISASRSIHRYQAWCYALGEYDDIDWDAYDSYGKPILRQLCEKYAFPIPLAR